MFSIDNFEDRKFLILTEGLPPSLSFSMPLSHNRSFSLPPSLTLALSLSLSLSLSLPPSLSLYLLPGAERPKRVRWAGRPSQTRWKGSRPSRPSTPIATTPPSAPAAWQSCSSQGRSWRWRWCGTCRAAPTP
jgi:hypothetical protein